MKKLKVIVAVVVTVLFVSVGHVMAQAEVPPVQPEPVLENPPLDTLPNPTVAGDFSTVELQMETAIAKAGLAAVQNNSVEAQKQIREAVALQFKLSDLYLAGSNDARFTGSLLRTQIGKYYGGIGSARSAPQVTQLASETLVKLGFLQTSQNAVLIQQNDRIIQLLEKLANSPSNPPNNAAVIYQPPLQPSAPPNPVAPKK